MSRIAVGVRPVRMMLMCSVMLIAVISGALHGQASSGLSSTGPHDVVVNGVRLWYRVAGAHKPGVPPVVFLHGGPGYNSHSFWLQAGPALERELRMIYVDQRGAGRSERPWTGEYSLAALASDIDEIRKGLEVPAISIIGHSFGGTLALEYAARYPKHVARLVIVSGAADLPAGCRARRQWLERHRAEQVARFLADTLRTKGQSPTDCTVALQTLQDRAEFDAYNRAVMFPNPAIGRRLDSLDAASGLRNTGEQQRALFATGLLDYRFENHERLTMPVLVLAGAHDSAIGLEQQHALARALPNAHIIEYERGGHFLYLDEPDRFSRDVIAFLGERAHGRRP